MAAEPVQRRLAAILAADVAGYSRLMGMDEEGTFASLIAHRSELFEPTIAKHQGRLVKTTGDGLLAEFSSVVDAVRCAVALQEGMAQRNIGVPDDRRIEFRIGVNLGDVMVQDGDVYGDGVNIAARLEALADPGGVYVSADAFRHVRGNLKFAFVDLGEQRLKNIAEPVHVWSWSEARDESPPADELATARAVLSRPAIAVLPFQNMSGDPTQDYFADGVSEEIITALARWREFPVIARNSTFVFKGQQIDVVRAAKQLGARYVLEGSVRRAGDRVRVTGQLIDGDSGHHLWAERYDRDLSDIFALQDEIAEKVATEVAPALKFAETQRIARKPPESFDAWDHYLRALGHRAKYAARDFIAAEHELEAAIRLDPDFGTAYGQLAIVCVSIASLWLGESDASLAKAIIHAKRAIQFDEADAMAHSALCFAYTYSGETEAGVTAGGRAVALNPNEPLAWYFLTAALLYSGRPVEALDAGGRAIALGPQEAWLWTMHVLLGLASYLAGRYEDCLSNIGQSRLLRPEKEPRRRDGIAAAALARLGRESEARAEAARLLDRWPDFGIQMYRMWPLQSHQRDELAEGLRMAGATR